MNLSGQEGNLFQVSLLGEGFVLFAQIFYATSGALLKKYGNQYDVVTLSGYQFMSGGLILILIGLFGGGRVQVESGVSAYILLLYLAFISAVAYTLWGVLLKYNPVSRVTVFGFMNPVFGVLLSALVLGDSPGIFRKEPGCPGICMPWNLCGQQCKNSRTIKKMYVRSILDNE